MQSEDMETVEIWERVNTNTIAIDVWLFDPRLYLEPWYVQRLYTWFPTPTKACAFRYWDCSENPNKRRNQDAGRRHRLQGFYVH